MGLMDAIYVARSPSLWFWLPWSLVLVAALRRRWYPVQRAAWWSLFGWCLLLAFASEFGGRAWFGGERLALWQLYVFAGIVLYIVGRGMQWSPRWAPAASPMVSVGATWSVLALFVLGFSRMHRYDAAVALPVTWPLATGAMLVLVAALMVWRYHDTDLRTLPRYRQGAFFWLIAAGALAMTNLLIAGGLGGWAALGYNLLALAGVVWLVLTGIERAEPRLINLGFASFLALALARAVEWLWPLAEGVVPAVLLALALLTVVLVLERYRRRLATRVASAADGQRA
jgi:hypothetical protein